MNMITNPICPVCGQTNGEIKRHAVGRKGKQFRSCASCFEVASAEHTARLAAESVAEGTTRLDAVQEALA